MNPNITISYKTPEIGTCITAFPKQKQFTGYVDIPANSIAAPYQQNFSSHTFFWFVESRESPETAPLTIWLNGGPGSSSMLGFFEEAGPCEVVLSDGSYGTQARPWGWDRMSNVIFIDQPTQVGFSYDQLTNLTLNLDTQEFGPLAPSNANWTLINGTFPSGQTQNTQNTTLMAASASWHFLQTFLAAFPQYNPGTTPNSTETGPTGINLFAESYGGQYAPAFADYFESQNAKRSTGEIPPNGTLEVKLTSVGIINGIVDILVQAPWWPKFTYDGNTYGVQAIDQTTELNLLNDFRKQNGCQELVSQCREGVKTYDPEGSGDESDLNDMCKAALYICNGILNGAVADKSVYDIRVKNPSPDPDWGFLEYLNTESVQRSIGAKVNFSMNSLGVQQAFMNSENLGYTCTFNITDQPSSWR